MKKQLLEIMHPDPPIEQRRKIPQPLLSWLEEAINDHDYGKFGLYFILHSGKMRWHKINEESGEVSDMGEL